MINCINFLFILINSLIDTELTGILSYIKYYITVSYSWQKFC